MRGVGVAWVLLAIGRESAGVNHTVGYVTSHHITSSGITRALLNDNKKDIILRTVTIVGTISSATAALQPPPCGVYTNYYTTLHCSSI